MAKKAVVFLADGFEEIEGLTTVDFLRRAGVDLTTVSIKNETDIMGSHNIPLKADTTIDKVDYSDVDMFILPGGGLGTENLEKSEVLKDILVKADHDEKFISAICAAPRVIGKLGFLNGRKATCFPGNEKFLEGAEYCPDEKAVTDGRFVTSRGMGASIEFAAANCAQLLGKAKAEEILAQIQY
ncbi:4-methyl-5(b-hydroxyethyl)-thiazole monophosphate biosynthesis [Lachnospiraceae bacterium]|nr:4-methyl-5(b-hydroxyethyl)-thiazole monophosphate biosynthesis [Lachnospiraceae bacterium]